MRLVGAVGIGLATLAVASSARAQHAGHGASPSPSEPMSEPMNEMEGHGGHHEGMKTPLGIPETREASGTSWQPDSTPMFMWHAMAAGWSLGLHTNVFVGFTGTGTDRGDDQLISTNWLMAMARHPLGDGDILFRTMLSAEPGTLAGDGYPLLLQTGETFDGMPLHDRQHPHDLFMEVAARIRKPLGGGVGVEVYGGPVGEPAIGPTAFPHRFTALADPLAPLGHHWHDSTHITFGVLTAGVFTKTMKLEGSWFNGREPDEDRWDFDLRGFDSVSARLTANPSRDLSAQVSWARLDSPEALEPDVSVHRLSGSVSWNRSTPDRTVAVSAAVGHNEPSEGPGTDAGLVEASWFANDTHTVFARGELMTKTGHDLVLPDMMANDRFGIGSLSAGYVYDFSELDAAVPGIGVVGTIDVIGASLEPFYGTRTPVSAMVFVRLRPPAM